MPIKLISTVKYYFFGLRPVLLLAITVILCCHTALSVVIQSLRLSLSPRLLMIVLLRLASMHSWRLPTGLGALDIQHFSTFLGLHL